MGFWRAWEAGLNAVNQVAASGRKAARTLNIKIVETPKLYKRKGGHMKADIIKIKNASTEELEEQFKLVCDEIESDNLMNPLSYARFVVLQEYKTAIYQELKQR